MLRSRQPEISPKTAETMTPMCDRRGGVSLSLFAVSFSAPPSENPGRSRSLYHIAAGSAKVSSCRIITARYSLSLSPTLRITKREKISIM